MIVENQKFINIGIIGCPNAGKSTLVNQIVGDKISIVSPKSQTTREIVRGIIIYKNTQIVFIDTPGMFIPNKTRLLERRIVRNAWQGISISDVCFLIVDSKYGLRQKEKNLVDSIKGKDIRISLILNKIDAVPRDSLLKITKDFIEYYPDFEKVFMISALKNEKIDDLKDYIDEIAPLYPWQYAEDEITDMPLKINASEITREKLFNKLNKELPYSIDVFTEKWENFNNGDIKIQQVIYALKNSQRSIIIGKNGKLLKQIGIEARQELEIMLNCKVHLYIFVKLKENWIKEKYDG